MNILMCLNSHYVYPMLATIHSLRKYNSEPIDLYLLSTNLSDEAKDLVTAHCKDLKINLKITMKELPNISDNPEYHFTVDTYLRCFAYTLLPQDVEKILYIDADMIFLDDVAKIYNIDLKNAKIACVRDIHSDNYAIRTYIKTLGGKGISHEYFNAGMLLMNVKQMRKDWNYDEIYQIAQSNKLKFLDQDLLNILCKNDELLFLRTIYNFQTKHNQHNVKTDDVILLHYLCAQKPWNVHCLRKHEKLFWDIMHPLGITKKTIEDFNKRN